jgi:hypothetical protein
LIQAGSSHLRRRYGRQRQCNDADQGSGSTEPGFHVLLHSGVAIRPDHSTTVMKTNVYKFDFAYSNGKTES